jgi:hypothetical protein
MQHLLEHWKECKDAGGYRLASLPAPIKTDPEVLFYSEQGKYLAPALMLSHLVSSILKVAPA